MYKNSIYDIKPIKLCPISLFSFQVKFWIGTFFNYVTLILPFEPLSNQIEGVVGGSQPRHVDNSF